MLLSSILPARPNLEHLRNQAKDLLKAYRSGDPSAIARFRASLPRYSLLTDDDLRRLSLSLGDAQRVVAAEYGFPNWLHLRHYVERKDGANMIEMTVDSVRVNNVTNLRTMVLKEKESDRYLPIWIGQTEGDAIAMRLEGQEITRPMTHRMIDTMIRDMGGEVRARGGQRYSGLYLLCHCQDQERGRSNRIRYEAERRHRAGGLYSGAPVFAAPEVLEKAGAYIDSETG